MSMTKLTAGKKGFFREMGYVHAVELIEDRSDDEYVRYLLKFDTPAVEHEVSAKRGFEAYVGWHIRWEQAK